MKNTTIKPYYLGAGQNLFDVAKQLRKSQTPAEKILWKILRNRRFNNYKFRRQHPLGIYIPDFYCHKAKLCIEVDGDVHLDKEVREKDKIRQETIESCGIKVLRFSNEEILNDMKMVLIKIEEVLNSG